MNNICAGIVLYNPDIDKLTNNINSIINQVSVVLLQDNGSSNIKEIEELIKQWENVKIIHNPVKKHIFEKWLAEQKSKQTIEKSTMDWNIK